MLVALWSPKGGSGTSVFAAACALALARARPTCLVDLAGDQPAILGLGVDPETGVREWLTVGIDAPVDALGRLTIDVTANLSLLPAGRVNITGALPEAGAALGVGLRDRCVATVIDAGASIEPAVDALVEVADASVVVVRGCYLALRRASRAPGSARAAGAVLLDEPGRALGARDVADVLRVPVLASVAVRSSIARVVDAGVLPARLPESLLRPARELLERLGCMSEGRAA
ncbi:MAG: hypothetical protein ACT4OX_07530 [Actinomycetota bacterium]